MKDFLSKYKKDIILMLVSCIFTIIFGQLFNTVSVIIMTTGNSALTALRNVIYYRAATIRPGAISLFFLVSFCGMLCGTLGFSIWYELRRIRNKKLLNSTEKLMDDLEKKPLSEIDKTEIEKVKDNLRKLTHNRDLKQKIGTLIFSVIVAIVCLGYTATYYIIPAEMQQEFERRCIQIRPFVDEKEILMLESKWISMRSKEDYDNIDKFIHYIKDINGLP